MGGDTGRQFMLANLVTAGIAAFLPLVFLLAAVATPILVIGALWGQADERRVPPDLEAFYVQVGRDTAVPWTALAAWDAVDNNFNLPVESEEQIFQRLVDQWYNSAESWCAAHPGNTSRCPPEMPENVEWRMHKRAKSLHVQQMLGWITGHANAVLAKHLTFEANADADFAELLGSRQKGEAAADLHLGYIVLGNDEDAPDFTDTHTAQDPSFIPAPGFAWPVTGPVTSRYGMRVSPVDGQARLHAGIDIGVGSGVAVHASKDGRVSTAGWDDVLGYVVVVTHSDGYTSVYAHNSVLRVIQGAAVRQGDVLALSGATGWATGPHVHFEIRKDGQPYDPLLFLGRPENA